MRSPLLARVVVVAAVAGTGAACGPPPVYDDTLGIEGVPVDEGSLAGLELSR